MAFCKTEEDLLSGLLQASLTAFPLSGAIALLFSKPLLPDNLTPKTNIKTIHLPGKSASLNTPVLGEVRKRWQDFSTQKLLTGEKNDWLALPLWSTRDRLAAVFAAEIQADAKISGFIDTLSLFVSFSEQVIQKLSSLRLAEKTLEHITSLYEAVETVSMREDPQKAIDLFAAYARALTGCEKVIFWLEAPPEPKAGKELGSFYAVKGKKIVFPEEVWRTSLLEAWSEIRHAPRPLIKEVEAGDPFQNKQGQLLCVPVGSRARCFGMLAALQLQDRYNVEVIIQTLSFLSELGAIAIERVMADHFAHKLLVIEEQDRIANEIHDSISQNLFSIVYGLDALHKKMIASIEPEQQQTLTMIRDLAAQTARELRSLIHRLSPRHRGDNAFLNEVGTYLDSLANLNGLSIDFQVEGREEFLNQSARWAFYRIIKEATSNAVRHGGCSKITVKLVMNPLYSNLEIMDNGRGFDVSLYSKPSKTGGKLGLVNIRELALTLKGRLNIESEIGKGTTVHCSVPATPPPSDPLPGQ